MGLGHGKQNAPSTPPPASSGGAFPDVVFVVTPPSTGNGTNGYSRSASGVLAAAAASAGTRSSSLPPGAGTPEPVTESASSGGVIQTMFGRKSHGDVKKSVLKILDTKKDTVTRLKHLRIVLESYDVHEAKALFEQYPSHIYFIFHDGFTSVEASLGQRASKSHREELDFMLFILEKILTLLPELIHKRWQIHSIGRIMKKLLHTGNSLKLRREGMRLFLLWYEILMENATEECHKMFRSLVPKLALAAAENSEVDLFTVRTFPNSKVTSPDVYPVLVPQSGDKQPDNLSKWLLDGLLLYMVSEVNKIEWNNSELHEYGFNFLFNKFKEYYLREIFVDFKKTSIYEPNLDLPDKRIDIVGIQSPTLTLCQETVVKWFANFMMQTNKSAEPSPSGPSTTAIPSSGSHSALRDATSTSNAQCDASAEADIGLHAVTETELPVPGSNASTMSTVSSGTERDSNDSSICGEEHSVKECEIVRSILFTSRENINIVHEVFRQAFLFPFHNGGAVRRVINVYKNWFQSDARPVFMLEPLLPMISGPPHGSDVDSHNLSIDASQNTSGNSETCTLPGDAGLAIESGIGSVVEVRAGLQRVLQVFITNSANVFLLEPPASVFQSGRSTAEYLQKLEDQVDMCKRVLNIYRFLVMNVPLEKATWEQLILVLLKITASVLTATVQIQRDRSLGGQLAEPLFKTLIVTWIKANLNIGITQQLWEQFLAVLSSLTDWVQLIREWAKTMEMLTRVLAKQVYLLDLHDLPLDKLTEQKAKRIRGTRGGTGSLRTRERSHGRSFVKQVSADNNIPSNSLDNIQASANSVQNGMPVVPRVASIRQRSRSGESSPVCSSQHDLSSNTGLASGTGSGSGTLVRSSSDSSILIDPDKMKGLYKPVDSHLSRSREDAEAGSGHDLISADGALLPGNIHSLIPPGLLPGPPSTSRLLEDESSNTLNSTALNPSDTASVTSSESQLPYQRIADASTDSISYGHGSFSDRSDTEALLRVSDSGSFSSSHSGVHRHKSSFERRHRPAALCNGTAVTELDEQPDEPEDEDADGVTEEMPADEANAANEVSLEDDAGGGGGTATDEEDEATMRSFEEQTANDIHHEKHDRDSLRIEDTDMLPNKSDILNRQNGKRSVLAGGTVPGWSPEVAVVLWQRMLGCLGNVNSIANAERHELVFEFLCDLVDTLIKIRNNQGVTKNNLTTPAPPTFVPPILLIAPWLFEALSLSDDYKAGKLLAYRLLCTMTLRRHDLDLPVEHLLRFYLCLHHGLVNSDQDVVNVLVKCCQAHFLALDLPASTMLLLDLIHGANTVLSLPIETKDCPRPEAMSMLGSMLCFPYHFTEIPVLQPNEKELTTMKCSDIKDHVVTLLLKFAKKESPGPARCIALSSLGIFLHAELSNGMLHPKIKDSFNVLLTALRFNDKVASQVAAQVLTLLSEHMEQLLQKLPELPLKVVEDLVGIISFLLPPLEKSSSESASRASSQVLVSVIFCLLEWCMRLPIPLLTTGVPSSSPTSVRQTLLHKVFTVLTLVITGNATTSSSRLGPHRFPVTTDVLEEDHESLSGLSTSVTMLSITDPAAQRNVRMAHLDSGRLSGSSDTSLSSVRVAARMTMMHLVNYLGHFPMGSGAAQMNSVVQEYSDQFDDLSDDLKQAQTLSADNIQFFVLNNITVITFIEIPVLDGHCAGVMAGLTTVNKVCRVIIRDPSGKYTWDSAVLYGPPNCRSGSYPAEPRPSLRIVEDKDLINENPSSSSDGRMLTDAAKFPVKDALDQTLQNIGQSSPECLLHPGEPLNAPFHAPVSQLPSRVEDEVKNQLLAQQVDEAHYLAAHSTDSSMMASSLQPTETKEETAVFHLCRLYLNHMGYMAWEKRKHLDLLRKSERLLRELKHLDNQRCRDTHKIAVIYVADGQEDKTSILGNKMGSPMYEQFVTALGWPVDLETHMGFMGGLQRSRTAGSTAPYYATSTKEVIFHVSTQMPSDTEEDQLRKLKHLGNDEVHIIWSEHSRDYRRGIIKTEFGDVLIVIYPIHNNMLFRIQIIRKPEVPYFGPLFDGAIIDFLSLPGLVRATAVNAGNMIRTLKPFYQPFYEERVRYVESIVQQHKLPTVFETFAAQVYSPVNNEGDLNIVPPQSLNDKVQPLQVGKAAKEDTSSFHRKLSLGRPRKSAAKNMALSSRGSPPPRSPNLEGKLKR